MSKVKKLTTAEEYKKASFEYFEEDVLSEALKGVQKSLEHHRRLKTYAHKFHPKTNVDKDQMIIDIGENHMAEYCALCHIYGEVCTICPLWYWNHCCVCEDSEWSQLNNSKTYGEFDRAEIKMIKILRKIHKELSEEVE